MSITVGEICAGYGGIGLVLTGEPRAAIQHGRNPILTLTCDVRDATDREAHDLAHRDDEHDEEVAA